MRLQARFPGFPSLARKHPSYPAVDDPGAQLGYLSGFPDVISSDSVEEVTPLRSISCPQTGVWTSPGKTPNIHWRNFACHALLITLSGRGIARYAQTSCRFVWG